MITNQDTDLTTHWQDLCQRMAIEEYRRTHDRLRVIITGFNAPELDDPADTFYVQIKATDRLRRAMIEYQAEYPIARDCFEDAPRNFLPQHGPQFQITETALSEVTGRWGEDDWRDGDIRRDCIEWALADFIYSLTGFHAKVEWTARSLS